MCLYVVVWPVQGISELCVCVCVFGGVESVLSLIKLCVCV